MNQFTLLAIKDHNHPQLNKGQDGTVYVGFGQVAQVVKLDLILPKGLRGLTYDEVKAEPKVGQFFELANLVLISAEEMQAYMKSIDMTGVTVTSPAKLHLPTFDPDHLRLREAGGKLLPLRMRELFSIVAAYWDGKNHMGIQPGLVAALWRRGMAAADIIRCIQASTGPDGEIVKASGRGHDIMQTVIEVYLDKKGLAQDAELSQAEMAELVKRWLTATRGAAIGTKDAANSVLHWSDYRRLGMVNTAGEAQVDQIRLIARKVFSINGQLSFRALASWIDAYHPPQLTVKLQNTKSARALLKKKRKAGKLNRKRGRR